MLSPKKKGKKKNERMFVLARVESLTKNGKTIWLGCYFVNFRPRVQYCFITCLTDFLKMN